MTDSGQTQKGKTVRFVPTRLHGVADELLAALLVLAPWVFVVAAGRAETGVPGLVGAGLGL